MRTRTWSENEKKEAIKDYYRKVDVAKYGIGNNGERGPSSEDVWRSREQKVPVEDGGFDRIKIETFSGSDEEWNERERERRRKRVVDLEQRIS